MQSWYKHKYQFILLQWSQSSMSTMMPLLRKQLFKYAQGVMTIAIVITIYLLIF